VEARASLSGRECMSVLRRLVLRPAPHQFPG